MSEIVPIARDSYRARILSTLDQEGILTVADPMNGWLDGSRRSGQRVTPSVEVTDA